MKKTLPLLILCLLLFSQTDAQFTRYIIKLKDKQSNPFTITNPSQFLSQRAIDRRNRYQLAFDSTDLPVTPRYIDSIRLAGAVTILNVSKWLNQVAIRTSDAAALAKINAFPFVVGSAPIGSFAASLEVPVNKELDVPNSFIEPNGPVIPQSLTDYYGYGRSNGQVKIHQGEFLHNHGFRGEGMQMAMLDAGFYHYQSLPTFDSMRLNNQVLGTWDFVANQASVDEDHYHGMLCLSTIAANLPGLFVGTAPKTSFYLFRTEDIASEYPIEEQNYAAGLERADSLGVDICSTSLGYYSFDNSSLDYTYNQMDGNTTISARAADLASKKGMLLVIAAGNEGNNSWHFLITPADADSVLSVGAVDTLGNVAGFSSYGPSSDGQVKPSVASVGWNAVVANTTNGQPVYNSGTSLACPNMAGLTTCLWQAFPEVNNMTIIDVLQQSATRPLNPDNRMGYGIPDMKKAFVLLVKKLYSQQAAINGCNASLAFDVKTGTGMEMLVERKLANSNVYTTLRTFQQDGAFSARQFSLNDDLSSEVPGMVTYRIKMTIAADTSFYLDSMTVQYAQTCVPAANNITVSPNPVSDNLQVMVARTSAAKVGIVVQNSGGQKVYSNQFQQAAGNRVETISMKRMSRGVYFVTVYIDNRKAYTKSIVR